MKKTILFLIILIITPACIKKSKLSNKNQEIDFKTLTHEKKLLLKAKEKESINNVNNNKDELDFIVQNKTGKTIYVVCFSYINKRPSERWRWDKSPIYKLNKNEKALIDIDTILDKESRQNVYGSLGIFNTKKEAINSTYELLKEKYRLDLDKLHPLKNKIVKIGIEKYGFKQNLNIQINSTKKQNDKLDIIVENKTGKNLWVCCFTYQKRNNMPIWQFNKSKIQLIKNNELKKISINTTINKYNRESTLGFLGVFDENKKEKAEKSTYELLKTKNKITLGRLSALKNKKITLEIEQYGLKGNFLEISIKPSQRIFK